MENQEINSFEYPEIFLAIDNCFASKRFTEPDDWLSLVRDLGLNYVEASADTECDPLYQGTDYIRRWVDKVQQASAKAQVKVCNLYSGHATYFTLGLGHNDPQVRERMLNKWLKPMVETAAALDAGLGFFCHAFSNAVLQHPSIYLEHHREIIRNLAMLADFAHAAGCKSIGLEQMYSPHQIPWTIRGSRELISQVAEKSKNPFYLTIDTGHQSGQQNFLQPSKKDLIDALQKSQREELNGRLWLGPDSAWQMFDGSNKLSGKGLEDLADEIMTEMDKYPYLFAEAPDSSPYTWLEELACFSPIIHLQQTDGYSSAHWSFTASNNQKGIIDGGRVMEALRKSFEKNQDMPVPKADRIYLTIEVFVPTAGINYYTLKELKESVRYWRQFVPEDGVKLNLLE